MAERICVIIADDDETIRKQIRKRVDGQMNITVMAEAASGRDAIALVKEYQPDLLLLDLTMLPGLDGLQVLKRVRHDHPVTKVVIVSQLTDHDVVEAAQELGAHGYIAKRDLGEDLIPAIEAVMAGGSFRSSAVSHERTLSITKARRPSATEKREATMSKDHDRDRASMSTSTLGHDQDSAARRETGRIRVLVLDDDPVVVQAIRTLLAKDRQIHLVGSDEDVCKNMEMAMTLIKQHVPHIVVLDLNLRGCARGGWRVVKKRTKEYAQVRIILCTVDTNQSGVSEAWREGVEGYVPKMHLRELQQAIHTVYSEKTYFSPSLGERVWRPSKATQKLTPRQREAFYLFVRGCSTAELMEEMCIGEDGVNSHKYYIRDQIGHQDGWQGVANEVRKEETSRKKKDARDAKDAPKYFESLLKLREMERKVFNQFVGRWNGERYVGGLTDAEALAEAVSTPIGEVKYLMQEIRRELNCHPDGWKGIAKDEGDID